MNTEELNRDLILSALNPQQRRQLDELIILDLIDSTNDYLLKLDPTRRTIACFAERQTAARGQRGKRWAGASPGQIYFSLLWPFPKPINQMRGLSLTVGIAMARTLRQYGVNQGLAIKWPNDVYYHGQKFVGILIETAARASEISNGVVVIGIGVNLHLSAEQGASIDQPWTSLFHILNQEIDRNHFAGLMLNELLFSLQQFSAQGFARFQAEWQELDYLYGKRIQINSPQPILTGIMQGISPNGELLLLDDQQQLHTVLNGTVRLAAGF